jgi:TonB family protein
MKRRLGCIICFTIATCLGVAAQTNEPELLSTNIPFYPPLARQARVYGTVKVTFTLPANAGEPVNVEAASGHPLLKPAAVENVKTWRFRNSYAVERRYETTFRYSLSSSESRHVTFESFGVVEIVSPEPPPRRSIVESAAVNAQFRVLIVGEIARFRAHNKLEGSPVCHQSLHSSLICADFRQGGTCDKVPNVFDGHS